MFQEERVSLTTCFNSGESGHLRVSSLKPLKFQRRNICLLQIPAGHQHIIRNEGLSEIDNGVSPLVIIVVPNSPPMFSLYDDNGTITSLGDRLSFFADGSFISTQTIPHHLSVTYSIKVSYSQNSTGFVVTCQHDFLIRFRVKSNFSYFTKPCHSTPMVEWSEYPIALVPGKMKGGPHED